MKVNLILVILCLSLANANVSCKNDGDCPNLNNCEDSKCVHKGLFPIAGIEWGGIIVILVLGIFATAGGAGGSVACTSFSLLLMVFETHAAVPLTQAFVFGGTLTTIVLKFKDRHPTVDRPMIYYDLALQLITPALLGTTIGVLLNSMFPTWVLLTLLSIIVAILLYTILKKGIQLYKQETLNKNRSATAISKEFGIASDNAEHDKAENKKEENPDLPEKVVLNVEVLSPDKEEEQNSRNMVFPNVVTQKESFTDSQESSVYSVKQDSKIKEKIEAYKASEKKVMNIEHLIYVLVLVGMSIATSALIGSKSFKSVIGLKLCEGGYFGILFAYIIIMLSCSLLVIRYERKKQKICELGKYKVDDSDLEWTTGMCAKVFFIGLISGFLVGLLALGAGYTIGPALLVLKVRPEVSTLTTSFVLCALACTALVQYFIFGMVDYSYAVVYLVLSILGALGGILGLRRLILKKGRPSLLVFAAAFTLTTAFIIFPSLGIYTAIQQSKAGNFQLGFKALC